MCGCKTTRRSYWSVCWSFSFFGWNLIVILWLMLKNYISFILNLLKKGPFFGQKAEFWKFGICGNPVLLCYMNYGSLAVLANNNCQKYFSVNYFRTSLDHGFHSLLAKTFKFKLLTSANIYLLISYFLWFISVL